MHSDTVLRINRVSASAPRLELCEHKGIGHPDSICDGVAEAVSRALSNAYLQSYGHVQHHNVDKALLIGGQTAPRFGGGEVLEPIRLILAGRATRLPGVDLTTSVCDAARQHLAETLHCDTNIFRIEASVREGSKDLQQVFSRRNAVPLANDTSVGVGYAPYSTLEFKVLELARILRSGEFLRAFPAAGDDFKIMGFRIDERPQFTVALAFVDREVKSVKHYFEIKAEATCYLEKELDAANAIHINMLDDFSSIGEGGIYLTVSGLSAEHGDDGQVGRGNRVNGLITPCRPMSLEAAAGKNPVAHVGKLYNVLAQEIAQAVCEEIESIDEASVQILSTIGKPVNEPQLISIQVVSAKGLDVLVKRRIEEIVASYVNRTSEISRDLIAGKISVF